jgi:hypothetical protein
MAEKMARMGVFFLFLAMIMASAFVEYNCCRDAGFSHDQCVYQITCAE